MSNLVTPAIITGIDEDLATQDAYEVSDNSVVNKTPANSVSGVSEDAIKKSINPSNKTTGELDVLKDTSLKGIDKQNLLKEVNKLNPDAQELLRNVLTAEEAGYDLVKDLETQISEMTGLTASSFNDRDITDDIIKGVVGEDGPYPNTQCNYLSSMFGGGDLGSGILLNLLLLAKMIECGFIDKVNELMETIDNPIVKKAVASVGVGSIVNQNVNGLIASKLSKNRVDITKENPFDYVGQETFEYVSPRLKSSNSDYNTTSGSSRRDNFYVNDLTETPLTEEESKSVLNAEDKIYGEIQVVNFTSSKVGEIKRTHLDKLNSDKVYTKGVDLDAVEYMVDIAGASTVKEVYPTIIETIIYGYRLPKATFIDYNEEYNRVMRVLRKIDPDVFMTVRDIQRTSDINSLTNASNDFIKLLTIAPNSEFEVEAMLQASYRFNDTLRLINKQYTGVKIS